MSKKILNILLSIVVLSIWGGVLYRILYPDKPTAFTMPSYALSESASQESPINDTLSLILSYGNPFDLHSATAVSLVLPENNGAISPSLIPKPLPTATNTRPRTISPKISYKGIVHGIRNKSALIVINEKSYIVSEFDQIQGVTVQHINDTIVMCTFADSTFTVKLH